MLQYLLHKKTNKQKKTSVGKEEMEMSSISAGLLHIHITRLAKTIISSASATT